MFNADVTTWRMRHEVNKTILNLIIQKRRYYNLIELDYSYKTCIKLTDIRYSSYINS